ncbi:MAG: hypothetical protein LBH98_05055 [Chitinispirillales bacterium]|jgi:hypothetical protein|nr:hypothetical protein [Chitinispirillales bacterium]
MKKTIELGRGIGNELLFGSRFGEVKSVLGEPDEVDNSQVPGFDEEEHGDTVVWIYDKFGISLYFDEEDEWRLGTIETDNEELTLNGEILIGRSFFEVKKILENMDVGEIAEEKFPVEETNGVETLLLFSDSKCLNIWFESGVCTEIQWSPFWENGRQQWAK